LFQGVPVLAIPSLEVGDKQPLLVHREFRPDLALADRQHSGIPGLLARGEVPELPARVNEPPATGRHGSGAPEHQTGEVVPDHVAGFEVPCTQARALGHQRPTVDGEQEPTDRTIGPEPSPDAPGRHVPNVDAVVADGGEELAVAREGGKRTVAVV
jgi:hypothetical protein